MKWKTKTLPMRWFSKRESVRWFSYSVSRSATGMKPSHAAMTTTASTTSDMTAPGWRPVAS